MKSDEYSKTLRAEIDTAAEQFGCYPEAVVNEALAQPRTVACSVCYGTGRKGKCKPCSGTGRLEVP